MHVSRRRFLGLGGMALCSLALGGCTLATAPPVFSQGASMRYPDWKTWCVGRYLVDFPAGVKTTMYSYVNKQQFVPLPNTTPQQVKQLAEQKIFELKNKPHDIRGNMFIRAVALANGGMLVQSWSFADSVDSSVISLYLVPENSNSVFFFKDRVAMIIEKERLENYIAFGSALRHLAPNAIPTEAGFCMDGLMLLDTPHHRDEKCALKVILPDAPDVTLAFIASTPSSDYAWLLEGEDVIQEACRDVGEEEKCTVLRKGKRAVGQIPAEELCVMNTDPRTHHRTVFFQWESPGKARSNTQQFLEASLLYPPLSYGVPIPAAPFSSTGEALDLWDRVVNSIRIRPVKA